MIKEIKEKIDKIDITGPAPTEETMRQYYFIKKCREVVKKESEKLGRKLTAVTTTFGCQMNVDTMMT